MIASDMLAVTWDAKRHARLLSRHPYLWSVKLDGVQGAWDGRHMRTRGGKHVVLPHALRERLPAFPVRGEFFMARGKFSDLSSLIRRNVPESKGWQDVSFRVFDVPNPTASFVTSYARLRHALPVCSTCLSQVCVLPQRPVRDAHQVERLLQQELRRGGEGIMLRRSDVPYRPGRQATLIKVKGMQDAEAVVLGYEQGRGKLRGLLGALRCAWVRDPGVRFRVGSGFSRATRMNYERQLPVGTTITVKFMNLDRKTGRPRHPVFKGVRV